MKLKEIISAIEESLPLWLQESYDNSGLQLGDPEQEIRAALLCVDLTEQVVEEARERGCNLIISHHPLLFKGLKRIGTSSYIERVVRSAIASDIAIYAAHTNADNAPRGINYMLAKDLGLSETHPLEPLKDSLAEIVVFAPLSAEETLQEALWSAGAGRVGQYDCCSFSVQGQGTFRALDGATPYVGALNSLHREPEVRISAVFPWAERERVVRATLAVHPYEEPAYGVYPLSNELKGAGSGIIGTLPEAMDLETFLQQIKTYFASDKISYTPAKKQCIRKVAICGGAGAFLWRSARRAGADIFITGEAKYNDYFDVEASPILVTVGHYESELIAVKLFREILSQKIPNFVALESALYSNPILSI